MFSYRAMPGEGEHQYSHSQPTNGWLPRSVLAMRHNLPRSTKAELASEGWASTGVREYKVRQEVVAHRLARAGAPLELIVGTGHC